jgi:NADPH:quinone reductase-like Zn-dependent oxidoreductase
MKAIISHNYGTFNELKLVTDFIKPAKIPKGQMLIKTEAVAVSPGDVRVLSGACKEMQGPPSFPYIPGGDLCGTIIDMNDVDPSKVGYGKGDRVAARFTIGPRGALGEFATVSPKMTGKVPDNLSSEEAAVLASSATIALCLSRRITKGERVIIVGGGGGVGSHLSQILRLKGTAYVAAASHEPDRMMREPLSCDNALDYTQKDVYDFTEWKKVGVDEKFDTVIDLSGGGWLRLMEQQSSKVDSKRMIVKPGKNGGRYLTLVPDVYNFEMHTIWQAMKLFVFTNLVRHFYSRFLKSTSLPVHSFAMSLDNDVEIMKETLKLASENKLKACIDDRGPFGFTTEGAQAAFQLQASRNVRGKVVISMKNTGDTTGGGKKL